VPSQSHRPIREQLAWLSAKLVGHFAYYGITGNSRRLQQYRHAVTKDVAQVVACFNEFASR
jgi:hypothetical protein